MFSIGVSIPGLGPMLGRDGPVHVGTAHVVEVDQFRAPGERAGGTDQDSGDADLGLGDGA